MEPVAEEPGELNRRTLESSEQAAELYGWTVEVVRQVRGRNNKWLQVLAS